MIHVPGVRPVSGSSVREHGDEPPYLGWLKLGRMKDGTRSAGESPAAIRVRPSLASVSLSEFLQTFAVAVRTFGEKVLDLLRRSKTWSLKHIGMALPGSSGAAHRGKMLYHPVAGLGTPMI